MSIKIHISYHSTKDIAMLKDLFDQERSYINYFFDHIDLNQMNNFFELLKNCTGMIVFTGVGKSGLVAKKIAATMTSTNSRAIFLSPINALHGDLGIIKEEDIFIFLSKSGESDELLNLVPSLRNKGVQLVAVVSNPQSRLAKACNFCVHLPLIRELCPYNLAPTTSTSIQMIFGDVMAIALMQLHNLSLDEYALNHPAGSIGKKITLKVRDLMLTENYIPYCHPNDILYDVLVELSNKRCGCLLVIDDSFHLLGIFTDGDLRRNLQEIGSSVLHKKMEEIMNPKPRTVSPNVLATVALKTMENSLNSEVTVLPVVDEEKKVLGLIKLHDIIQTGIS